MRYIILCALLSLSTMATAQDVQGIAPVDTKDALGPVTESRPIPPPPRISPLEIIRAKKNFRLTKRVIFVIDTSGSMKDYGRLVQAIQSSYLIINWGQDDFHAAVITFTDSFTRWAGVQEKCKHPKSEKCNETCDKPGWTKIPTYLMETVSYLLSLSGDGLTVPGPALKAAIEDREEETTIVFVSDGSFSGDRVVSTIEAAQKVRKARGQQPVPIMVWGAGDSAKDEESLKRIAKVGGGGLWVHGKNRSGPF